MSGVLREDVYPNATYVYVGAFVDELQRAGVHNVVICPGSRSTPLALSIAAHPALRPWMHVDERSAAFFALGMAKRLGQPVALLCTSGTAAANFLPALIEAKLTHVPLLVLTADRPHELRDCGAPQAIDQNRLYGTHVKWFVDVALPEATNEALRYIRTLACRAAALTQAVPAGPVHLNMPFREPLLPEPLPGQTLPPLAQRDTIAWQGRPDNEPYVAVSDAPLGMISSAQIAHLADLLRTTPHGLIVVGPYANPALAAPLLRLAQRAGYPILADPLSQLRCGDHDHTLVLTSYDAFLRRESFIERMAPELVLRFGAMPTAKPLLLYLKRYAHCPQVVIDEHGGWDEPTQLASELLHTDAVALCDSLCEQLESQVEETGRPQKATIYDASAASYIVGAGLAPAQKNLAPAQDAPAQNLAFTRNEPVPAQDASTQNLAFAHNPWLARWLHADQATRQALQVALEDFAEPFEGRVFTELAHILPDGTTLYAGNSMPVRDMDTFFWGSKRRLRLIGNRGASGIDGMVSSALGVSAASEPGEPTVLVIGDLSFFHDLNGLLAAHLHKLNLTVVLVNNDGGGIFSFLPQAAYPEHFEQLFGTPTGLDFRPVVQMHGGEFQRVQDWQAFREAVQRGMTAGGLHVIELATERESNVRMHRQLWQVVERALCEEVFDGEE